VPEDGLEPSRGQAPRDFKSLVSTTSTTQALSGEGTAGWTQSSISGAAFQLGPRLHLERFVAASDSPVKPVIKTHADRRVVFSAPCASHNIDYGPLGGIGDHERSVLGNANRAPPRSSIIPLSEVWIPKGHVTAQRISSCTSTRQDRSPPFAALQLPVDDAAGISMKILHPKNVLSPEREARLSRSKALSRWDPWGDEIMRKAPRRPTGSVLARPANPARQIRVRD
jgi:hypothetical protein